MGPTASPPSSTVANDGGCSTLLDSGRPELEAKEAPTLPDSTTDHHQPSPAARARQSFLFSPDKLSFSCVPFSPVNLDSITPLKLSPVKQPHGSHRQMMETSESWWSTAILTPENSLKPF